MGLFSNLITRTLGLTESQRSVLFRVFGSFEANRFGLSNKNFVEHGYERSAEVFSVISTIVDVAGNVPYVLEKKVGDEWEAVTDSPLLELMEQPNRTKGYTWEDIINHLDTYTLTTGNGILKGERSIGIRGIAELDVLPTPLVDIETSGTWLDPVSKYVLTIDKNKFVFDSEEISHIKLFNPGYSNTKESQWGLSPIKVAASIIQSSNDKWDASAFLMQNRGAAGMITDKGDRPQTPTEVERMQAGFDNRARGLEKFGRVLVTNKNLDFISMAMSANDLKLIEHGVVNLRAICSVFKVDSSLFNDPANKTFNNRKEAEKSLYSNAVMPLIEKRTSKLNSFLTESFHPGGGYRLRADYSGVEALQEDFHEKAKTIALLKNSGIITANTAAQKLNLPISEDENADKLIISTNLVEELNKENEQRNQSEIAQPRD